jgi:hypothetical protein
MESRPEVEVVKWSAESAGAARVIPVRRRYAVPPSIVGFIGTCLVHALLVQSLVLGTAAKKVRLPEITGPDSTESTAGSVSELTLIVVQLVEPSVTDTPWEEIASTGMSPKDLAVALLSSDPAPAVDIPADTTTEDPHSESTVTSNDPAGRARLFGIYSGQIQARIERLWRRPRTPVNDPPERVSKAIGDDIFRCQVQVNQSADGTVQEILLPNCNGSSAWKKSLVVAIQQASPLPAPPDPKVFSQAMTFTFVGLEFRPGSAPDDYEIESRHIQAQN